MAFDRLQQDLASRKSASLYRQRRLLQSPQGPHITLDQQSLLAFCSNDYLGLANDPRLKSAMINAVNECGVGGGASHLVNGHHEQHHLLELELAEFLEVDRVLCFSTGYMANIGAVNAVLRKQDQVFEDRLNHASLLDAGLLSGAKFSRYLHGDIDNLRNKMDKNFNASADRLVVTDGVFSMDGDIAPLSAIAQLCSEKDAWLMVDDAHGVGVVGESGRGTVHEAGLGQDDVAMQMGTLGKAFGSFGAFVGGREEVVETLIQQARAYIYTTAIPPAVAAASRESLKIVRDETWRREHLTELISEFRVGCERIGLQLMPSDTPIQPVIVGSAECAMKWSAYLQDRGVLVTAIRPPTVPNGTSRLRVTFSAAHQMDDVRELLRLLEEGQGESFLSQDGVLSDEQ